MMLTPFQQYESQRTNRQSNKERKSLLFPSAANTCPQFEQDGPVSKLTISIPQSKGPNHEQWCEQVKQLKLTTTNKKIVPYLPVEKLSAKENHALAPANLMDENPRNEPDKLNGEGNIPGQTKCKRLFVPPLYVLSGPRVRFQDDEPLEDDSTCSLTKCSSTKVSSTQSTLTDTSHRHHSTVLEKKRIKKLYYTRKETKRIILAACDAAEWFRATHRGAVKQMENLFQETCGKDPEDCCAEEDEDEAELLRNFLLDWAESDARGLEEKMVAVLRSERQMTIQSILAYQEKLREQHSGDFFDDHYSVSLSDLLRARSESASRKARIFAMYLALGDALVAASDDLF